MKNKNNTFHRSKAEADIPMKIPYGLSNFKNIISQGYLYIDKTDYIETLEEQGSFNILLRPRRFGKSLFLSMLWYYYDIRFKDEFAVLFGELAIGKNPTPLRNKFKVLALDFNGIATTDAATIINEFTDKVETDLIDFLERYGYSQDAIMEVRERKSPQGKIDCLFRICKDEKIYLLIDEYDNFANAILGESQELFQDIVGKGGFVRAFYENIKSAVGRGIVDRFFITGVTSLALDSMTSGFNIAKNLSHRKEFNQAIGFSNDEVKTIVQPLVEVCDLDQKKLMIDLAKWYNGYRFNAHCRDMIFNSDMVLYFVDCFDLDDCRYPEQMLDENIASDYSKIMALFAIGDSERNFATLEELITTGETIGLHKRKLDLDVNKKFDREDFLSLLLYMGFITISGMVLNELRYTVPNYVIQRLYYHYFKVEIEQRSQITMDSCKLKEAVMQLALHNNITPMITEIGKVLALFSNRDFMRMDEKHIKAVILTLLYQSEVYFIQSEPEVNNRYPDILLLERNPIKVNHQFLFELKYSKKKDGKRGMDEKRAEGIKQIKEYQQLADIRDMVNLKSYLLLTNGSEIEAVAV